MRIERLFVGMPNLTWQSVTLSRVLPRTVSAITRTLCGYSRSSSVRDGLLLARVMISLSLDLGPPSKTLPHGVLIRHDRSLEIVPMMTLIATSNEAEPLPTNVSHDTLQD